MFSKSKRFEYDIMPVPSTSTAAQSNKRRGTLPRKTMLLNKATKPEPKRMVAKANKSALSSALKTEKTDRNSLSKVENMVMEHFNVMDQMFNGFEQNIDELDTLLRRVEVQRKLTNVKMVQKSTEKKDQSTMTNNGRLYQMFDDWLESLKIDATCDLKVTKIKHENVDRRSNYIVQDWVVLTHRDCINDLLSERIQQKKQNTKIKRFFRKILTALYDLYYIRRRYQETSF